MINNFARLESRPKWSKNVFAKFEQRIRQTNYKYLSEVNSVSLLLSVKAAGEGGVVAISDISYIEEQLLP